MSEPIGTFSNFALYRTTKSEYLFLQYFHNPPFNDTDKIICLKSNIKSVKGQVTISFLHLSADTELRATHTFKKKMWKSQLPNPSIQTSRYQISRYNNHYTSLVDQRAYLHMIQSTCPIYGCQCLISSVCYLRKGKIMQTIVLAQDNEHYCILLHHLLKSQQIQ